MVCEEIAALAGGSSPEKRAEVIQKRAEEMSEVAEQTLTNWVDELMGIVRPEDGPMPTLSYVVSNDETSVQYRAVFSMRTLNCYSYLLSNLEG